MKGPGFLGSLLAPKMTVAQYAGKVMDEVGIPAEYRARFLPILIPYFDPARSPDYAAILVRAGQPCTKSAVQSTIASIPDKLKQYEEGGVDEEQINDFYDATFRQLALTFAVPLETSPLRDNLMFDANGNAVAVKNADISRMYICDRFLELRNPVAHKTARESQIQEAATVMAGKLQKEDIPQLQASVRSYSDGVMKAVTDLKQAKADAPPATPYNRLPLNKLQALGSARSSQFTAESAVRALATLPEEKKKALSAELTILFAVTRGLANEIIKAQAELEPKGGKRKRLTKKRTKGKKHAAGRRHQRTRARRA